MPSPISKFPQRRPLAEVIRVAITPEQKARAFEVAAKRGLTMSQLTRAALAKVISDELRAA